jgi:hypothetical protein
MRDFLRDFSKKVLVLLFSMMVYLQVCQGESTLSPLNEESVSPPAVNRNMRLHVLNSRIVDSKDRPVKLRGIYTRAEWLDSEEQAQWFKKWGVNFVRMLLTYDREYWQIVNDGTVDMKKRCILRESNLIEMDKKCSWLEKRGIYFIIEVPWKWYGISQELEEPDLLAGQCARMYGTLAQRYKNMNYLMGFCMFSEIYIAPWHYESYKKICTAIVDAVHAVDPGYIVSVTGTRVSSPDSLFYETRIERPNVIYDFHYYDIKSFVAYRPYFGDMRYPGRVPHGFSSQSYYLDKKLHETFIAPAISFSNRYQVPVWCGEFGAFNNAPDGSSDRWMRDVCRIFERNGIPWIIWTWDKGDTDVPQLWKDLWQGKLDDCEVTISPHGGRFTDELSVQIDSWTSKGRIYYTLDGSEPNESSNPYNGPFKVNATTIVEARMICPSGVYGPVDATVFEFGGLKPLELIADIKPGLRYTQYNTAVEKIENLVLGQAQAFGLAVDFNQVKLQKSDGKTLVYEGLIAFSPAGRYFFYPVSYGAYELFIDDVLVNRHFATQLDYARTSPGIITLEAGIHRLKIIYSKPADYEDGFELKLQRDTAVVKPPHPVGREVLFYEARTQPVKTDQD